MTLPSNDTIEFSICEPVKNQTFALRNGNGNYIGLGVERLNGNLVVIRSDQTQVCEADQNRNVLFSCELRCGSDYSLKASGTEELCETRVVMVSPMGCAIYSLKPLYHLLGVIFILAGVFMTICGNWVQKWFMAGLVQVLTFLSLMEFFVAVKIFDKSFSLQNSVACLFALILSISTAFVIGKIFRRTLRLGPIIVGIGLGVFLVLMTLPFVEMTINFVTAFDLGFWISSICVAFGGLFGAYIGFRLAFVILIATQAFMSAYLVVRGISLNLGGFPSEILILKDMFGLTSPDEDQLVPDLPFLLYACVIFALTVFSLRFQMNLIYRKQVRAHHQFTDLD